MADSLVALILFLVCAWFATAARRVTPADAIKPRAAISTLHLALRYLRAQESTHTQNRLETIMALDLSWPAAFSIWSENTTARCVRN